MSSKCSIVLLLLLVILVVVFDSVSAARTKKSKKDEGPKITEFSKCKQGMALEDLKNYGREYMRSQKFFEAIECFSRALKIHKTDAEMLRHLGFANLQVGRSEEAEAALKQAVKENRADWESLIMLGQVEEGRMKYDKALEHYRNALKYRAQDGQLYAQIGFALSKLGAIEESIEHYQTALKLDPQLPQVRTNLGSQYRKLGKLEEAKQVLMKAIEMHPKHSWDARVALGKTKFDLGNQDEALRDFVDVLIPLKRMMMEGKLDRRNARAGCEAAIGAAKVHYERSRKSGDLKFEIAGETLEMAASLCNFNVGGDPSLQLQALVLGGLVSFEMKNISESQVLFEKAVGLRGHVQNKGGSVGLTALAGLGRVFATLGNSSAAADLYLQAIQEGYQDDLQTFCNAYGHQVFQLKEQLRWKEWAYHLPYLRNISQVQCHDQPNRYSSITAFESLLYPLQPDQVLCITKSFAAQAEKNASTLGVPPFVVTNDHERPSVLRVGYMSSDFGMHTMCERLAGVLAKHSSKVQVHVFSLSRPDDSECRKRINALAAGGIVDLSPLSDAEAVLKIRSVNVDVLVDLNGHTKGSRLSILASRAAPSQIMFFGWAGPMGAAKFVDAVVSDGTVTPPELANDFDESPVALLPTTLFTADYTTMRDGKLVWNYLDDDTVKDWSWEEPAQIDAKAIGQVLTNASNHGKLMASFNRMVKLDHEAFASWLRIMMAVPDSVLWMTRHPSDPADTETFIKSYARAVGINPDRIVITSHMDESLHMIKKKLVSLHLDTFVYNAHSTAADALWVGAPTLTVPGLRMSDRIGASLSVHGGCKHLVGRNYDDYFNLGASFLQRPKLIARTKNSLRERAIKGLGVFDVNSWMKKWESLLMLQYEIQVIKSTHKQQKWHLIINSN